MYIYTCIYTYVYYICVCVCIYTYMCICSFLILQKYLGEIKSNDSIKVGMNLLEVVFHC